VYSDWEDVTSSGRAFQVFRSATGKARLPTVDRLTGGTRRRLVPVDRGEGGIVNQIKKYECTMDQEL